MPAGRVSRPVDQPVSGPRSAFRQAVSWGGTAPACSAALRGPAPLRRIGPLLVRWRARAPFFFLSQACRLCAPICISSGAGLFVILSSGFFGGGAGGGIRTPPFSRGGDER